MNITRKALCQACQRAFLILVINHLLEQGRSRMKPIQRTFLVVVVCQFMASHALAQTDHWAAGAGAFESSDYQTALNHFISARDGGLEGPAVHYNIAVSQFKLGRFDDAAETFRLIADRYPQMEGLLNQPV